MTPPMNKSVTHPFSTHKKLIDTIDIDDAIAPSGYSNVETSIVNGHVNSISLGTLTNHTNCETVAGSKNTLDLLDFLAKHPIEIRSGMLTDRVEWSVPFSDISHSFIFHVS
jgi:hypothetical protein